MFGRVFAAALLAAFAAGSLLGSAPAWAKGSGFKGTGFKPAGLSAKAQGLFARHGFRFRRSAPSVSLPPIVPPFKVFSVAPAAPRFGHASMRYRRAFGAGLPAGGIGIYYGASIVAPDDVEDDSWPPTAASPARPAIDFDGRSIDQDGRTAFAEIRGGCLMRTRLVAAEDGGERRITVRRC